MESKKYYDSKISQEDNGLSRNSESYTNPTSNKIENNSYNNNIEEMNIINKIPLEDHLINHKEMAPRLLDEFFILEDGTLRPLVIP